MTVEAGQSSPRKVQGASEDRAMPWFLVVLVGLLVVLTPALALLTDGNPGIVVAPVLAIGFVYMLWKIPLRYPAIAILFLGLTLECPGTGFASDLWVSPTHQIGQLFFYHWNLVLPIPPLIFSGIDFLLLLLFPIAIYRRATQSRIDGEGFIETASPIRYFCGVTIFGALFIWLWGAARGGMNFRFSLWQVDHAVYLPVFVFLLNYAVRLQDVVAVGKMVIAASLVRALMAIGIRTFVNPHTYELMPCATGHDDSLLFAEVFCLCIALVVEVPSKKHFKLAAFVLPILSWGMVANNRRLVWVDTIEALLVLFFMIPLSRAKRKFVRYVLLILPAFAVYVAVGWEGQGGALFAGARMMRSLVDSKTDRSTEWRDLENFDLVATLKTSPVLGVGYGHPYIDAIQLDKIPYELEHYLPHNSVLGLWAYGGVVGFSLLWTTVAVTAFFAARCYKFAKSSLERLIALAAVAMIVIYMSQCYGDVGFGSWTSVFLMSIAITFVGKLALTTGAWPSRVASPSPARGRTSLTVPLDAPLGRP